jgi:hypothetical protein
MVLYWILHDLNKGSVAPRILSSVFPSWMQLIAEPPQDRWLQNRGISVEDSRSRLAYGVKLL